MQNCDEAAIITIDHDLGYKCFLFGGIDSALYVKPAKKNCRYIF